MTSLRPDMDGSQVLELPNGKYGVPDMMMHGFQNVRSGNTPAHPLQHTEKHWHENQKMMDFAMLRNLQGLHAPSSCRWNGTSPKKMRRLPVMPSSHVLEDSLTGRDMMLDFEDIFNEPDDVPLSSQPHIQMEKHLRIL